MTVEQLKTLLQEFPDHMQVYIRGGKEPEYEFGKATTVYHQVLEVEGQVTSAVIIDER